MAGIYEEEDEDEYKVRSPEWMQQTAKSNAAVKSNDAAGKAKSTAKASAAMGGGSRLAQALSGAMASSKAATDAYSSGYDSGLNLAQRQADMERQQSNWRKDYDESRRRYEKDFDQRQTNWQTEFDENKRRYDADLEERKKQRKNNLTSSLISASLGLFGGNK